MTPKAATMLKVLLNRYHQGSIEEAMGYFPKDCVDAMQEVKTLSNEIQPAIAQPKELLKSIHYSWLIPFIEKQPQELAHLYLQALPEPLSSKLADILKMKREKLGLSCAIKAFLQKQVYHAIYEKTVLPSVYLPPSSLNVLANYSKSELLILIDYLGLYDLAEAIRQVVDKRYLKQLYLCLTKKKQDFLRSVLHQREKLVSQRLNLDNWSGNCNELKQLLHRRGILRFGFALTDEHPDLIWRIIHTVDTGRATILEKCIAKEKPPGVVPALAGQLVNLIHFLK